ncbi:MAG TPA: adenine phosphoribosyltransferase [Candidatus Nanoarchaeia archaeon]|nr:adenine phosphoribosyltransferase [Candidatus Nanoarchaeia archaeon]
MEELIKKIRDVPDFPKKGVVFKDITPLLADSYAFRKAIRLLAEYCRSKGKIDAVVCAESRGFIFGSALAYEIGAGFVPLRKPGKLPYKTLREEFQTEYSTDAFEVHEDAVKEGKNVIIVDDVLATGGTARAACNLVKKLGGNVLGLAFLIELEFLNGREKINEYDVLSLIKVK